MGMKEDAVSDFRFRRGSPGGAFLSLSKAIVKFIMLPLGMLALIAGIGNGLPTGGMDFAAIIEQLSVYLNRLMVYAIPLVILAIPLGFYPKGNYARIPFKLIYGLYLALLLLLFTDGGVLSMSLDGSTLGIEGLTAVKVDLRIQTVIYILALISVVKAFMAFAEFGSYRKDYLKSMAEKEEAGGDDRGSDGNSDGKSKRRRRDRKKTEE